MWCSAAQYATAVTATMAGGNVAHNGPGHGNEDDLLLMTLEFGNNTYAALEYGSAFRWPEHYVLIEGHAINARIHVYSFVAQATHIASWFKHGGRMDLDQIVTIYTKLALRELNVIDADARVNRRH